jgi:hypothetical protein
VRRPHKTRLAALLRDCVGPAIPIDVRVVYVLGGTLPQGVTETVTAALGSRRVVFKTSELRSAETAESRVAGVAVTSHFDAAADLVVAAAAAVVVSADYSSFAKALHHRHCPLPASAGGAVGAAGPPLWTYDRDFRGLTRRPCDAASLADTMPFTNSGNRDVADAPPSCKL